jgi:hypothetical protein
VRHARPSAAVTVAARASTAETSARSTASGNGTLAKTRPSVERYTAPAGPTSQQTEAPGAAPATTPGASTPVVASQLDPPSVLRSTRPSVIRHRMAGFGDAISRARPSVASATTARLAGAFAS